MKTISTPLVALVSFGAETTAVWVFGPDALIAFGVEGTTLLESLAQAIFESDSAVPLGLASFGAETSTLWVFGPNGLASFGAETTTLLSWLSHLNDGGMTEPIVLKGLMDTPIGGWGVMDD